jgi:hypothetical protein
VKKEEEKRAEELRKEVAYKELKIWELDQERKRIISESKCRALSLAELRHQIRYEYLT